MKAIAVNRGPKTKYFSTEAKALEYLASRSHNGKVYNRMMDEVSELYINELCGTSYFVKANNEKTIFDALGMFEDQKEDFSEYDVTYINID